MVTIDDFMSHPIASIPGTSSLAEASERMVAEHVRHLLVVDNGDGERTIGVLSREDIYRLESIKRLVHPEVLPVHEAMSPEPYVVRSGTPLQDVVVAMVDRRIGSAVVVDDGHAIGLFTTTDALRALSVILRSGAGS